MLYVKKGTYTPTAKKADGSLVADPRDATYVLPDEITIYGGFAGTEANLEARRMDLIATTNETIIEGNIGDMATYEDNVKDLFTVADEATLDGLTVARGNSSGDGAGLSGGEESEVTIRHCRFIENRANNGGAIFIDNEGTLTIASSHFESNTAGNTGGGAIYVDEDGTLMVSSSTFERNNHTSSGAVGGGAICMARRVEATITTSVFEENTSVSDGGAVVLHRNGTGTISRCSFIGNITMGLGLGTVYLNVGSMLDVSNSVFANNRARNGSVLYSDGNGTFINNTVYGNRNEGVGSNTSSVRIRGTNVTWVVANNIIYGNMGGGDQLHFQNAGSKTLAHNLIEGNRIQVGTGTLTRTGGIASPGYGLEMFVSLDPTDEGYLRPLGGSVLADGGNNDYIDGNADAFETADAMGLKDLAGGARIVNTTIDVGAYEALLPSAASLRVLDEASGALLGATGNAVVPSGGGRYVLRVAYTGADAMGVSITGASDFATLSATSTTTPSARINLDIAENMTTSSRSVELTFTLNGVTPVQTQVVMFMQKRRPARIFVTEEGMSSANGLGWATATTLNKALSMSASEGDTVYVKTGSYTPTDSAGVQAVDPRNGRYVLLDGMKVYGGFLGTETSLEDRNEVLLATINETIIEGNRGEAMSSTDNVRSLFNLGEDERARLDGFTIARANGEASSAIELGVFSRLTLSSCRLIGNRNTSGGGALRSARNASLGIEGSLFEENSSSGHGAAIYADEWASVSVTGTRFEENTLNEGDEGLAIYFARNGRGRVVRSVFLRNSGPAESSGTLFSSAGVSLHVSSSLFAGNSAEDGSTLFSLGSGGSFVNNTVYGNTDRTMTLGTLSLEDGESNWVIANNILYGNATANEDQYELSMADAMNKTLVHNLIEGDDIKHAPMRVGAISPPSSAALLFASLDAMNDGYLRLLPASAGIDAGNNDYIDGSEDAFEVGDAAGLSDLSGGNRIINGTVDLGAYESQNIRSVEVVADPAVLTNLPSSGGTIRATISLRGSATGYRLNLALATFTTSNVSSGMGDGRVVLTYAANTMGEAREDTVIFIPTGGAGVISEDTLFLIQEAPPQTIRLNPDNIADVPAAGGTRSVMLTLGGGATGYTITGADDWVEIPAMATNGAVAITLRANTSRRVRRDRITFTPTGAMGEAMPATLMISQLGAVPMGSSVTIDPIRLEDIPASGGRRTVSVTLGGGATGYSVPSSGIGAPASWVTLPATGMGGNLTLTLSANTMPAVRKDTVYFIPTGGMGETVDDTLYLTQQAVPQTIRLNPDNIADVPAAGGTRMVMLSFGGGATGYTVAEGETWVMVPATATGGSLTITLRANASRRERRGMVIFTPTGGEGEPVNDTLHISQLGALPMGSSVTLSPNRLTAIPSAGGSRTVRIALGGGATGYRVHSSGIGAPASWVTVPAMATGGSLTITLGMNPSRSERKDTVYFSPTGGMGETVDDTLYLSQDAGAEISYGSAEGVFAEIRVVNPVSKDLIIYGLSVDVALSLHDLSGQVVLAITLPANKKRTALPPLTRGVYVLSLRTKEGETYYLRLLMDN